MTTRNVKAPPRSLGNFARCHGCHVELMPPGVRVGVTHVVMDHPEGRLFGLVAWCVECRPDRAAHEAEEAAFWARWRAGAAAQAVRT